jgi:hypothetical protein
MESEFSGLILSVVRVEQPHLLALHFDDVLEIVGTLSLIEGTHPHHDLDAVCHLSSDNLYSDLDFIDLKKEWFR